MPRGSLSCTVGDASGYCNHESDPLNCFWTTVYLPPAHYRHPDRQRPRVLARILRPHLQPHTHPRKDYGSYRFTGSTSRLVQSYRTPQPSPLRPVPPRRYTEAPQSPCGSHRSLADWLPYVSWALEDFQTRSDSDNDFFTTHNTRYPVTVSQLRHFS